MSRNFNFSVNINLDVETEEQIPSLGLGEIEEYIEELGDYKSVKRQDAEKGNVFHIKYEDFILAVGAPYIRIDYSGGREDIQEIVRTLDSLIEYIIDEFEGEPKYTGNMNLSSFVDQKHELFEQVESPIEDYEQISALALTIKRKGQKFGLSINESDGEKSMLNLNYSFKILIDEESENEFPEILETMFDTFNEIATEVGN